MLRIFKFVDTRNRPTWIAWFDYWKSGVADRTVTLEVAAASVLVTEAVPRAGAGAEIIPARYRDAFPTATLPVVGGRATISLGQSPVLVQPGPLSGAP